MSVISNPKNSNPPYFSGAQYNPSTNNSGSTTSTQSLVAQLTPYFLQFPSAQGQEFLSDVIVNGDLIVSDTNNQFVSNIDLNMKGNVLLDSSANYIQFGDGSVQNTATPADDPYTVYADISNNFLSGTIQTFQGSNTTIPTNAPLRFSNVNTNEYGSLFVDPSPNNDLTIYSNQAGGGLTVANSTNSFTVNPTTTNTATFLNPIVSNASITGKSLGLNTSGADAYTIYSNTTPVNYGVVIANTTGANGNFTISNNGGISTTLTSTSTGLSINDALISSGGITGQTLNISNFVIFPNSQSTGISNYSQNSLNPVIYFALNDTSNNQVAPLLIFYNAIQSNVFLNMTGHSILNTDYITFSDTTIQTTAFTSSLLTPYALLASPAFTGTPTAPTPLTSDRDGSIATTSYVQNNLDLYAELASPALTGTATLNTQPIATTDLLTPLAPINNPIFTGNPRAPTPASGDMDTSIATTEFVQKSTTTFTNTINFISSATILTSLTPAVFYTISPKMCVVNVSNLYFTGTTSQNYPYLTIYFNTIMFPNPYTIKVSSVYGYIQNTTTKVLSFPQSYYLETGSQSISMYYNINNSNNYVVNVTFTMFLT